MSFSKISLWFSCILMSVIAFFYYPKWNKESTEATISWDISGYYWYLPAFLIYEDVRQLGFSSPIIEKYRPTPANLQSFKHKNNNYVLKYSSGQALLMLPGFICGHLSAKILGYPQDGFSIPYQFGIFLWGLLVSLIGLIFLRKVLILYFSETATGLTLLAISFATNFLEYGAITNAMTHNFLFTLYAILIFFTIKFYTSPTFKNAAGIGIIIGFMALTRPTEILSVMIPVLFGLSLSWKDIVSRLVFWGKAYEKVIVAVIATGVIGSLQLFYWKFVSGDWLVYSYEDQGFSWLKPHVLDCLFSGRAGWLIYTPVMVLSLIGFYFLFKKNKPIAMPFLLFSVVFMYVTFAWDIWWYGGSVSQRALVQIYPVLAFPLAAFFQSFTTIHLKSILVTSFGLFCVHYNFWMTHHCHYGGLFVAGDMTSEYLKAIFLREKMPPEGLKLLDTRKIYNKAIKNPLILMSPQDTATYIGNVCLNDTLQFSPAKKFSLPAKEGWLRASADFKTDNKEWEMWKMTQLVIKYYKNNKDLRSDVLRVQRHLNQGQKVHLWLDSKLRYEPDEAEIYLWNAESKTSICAENIQLVFHKGE
ncbi:MAG: glycosyltransferase family 39 protein [Saprospiraceae bacterium]|nr:glycosyltransferase family 39 protein [Saprospiraceae bacterium]